MDRCSGCGESLGGLNYCPSCGRRGPQGDTRKEPADDTVIVASERMQMTQPDDGSNRSDDSSDRRRSSPWSVGITAAFATLGVVAVVVLSGVVALFLLRSADTAQGASAPISDESQGSSIAGGGQTDGSTDQGTTIESQQDDSGEDSSVGGSGIVVEDSDSQESESESKPIAPVDRGPWSMPIGFVPYACTQNGGLGNTTTIEGWQVCWTDTITDSFALNVATALSGSGFVNGDYDVYSPQNGMRVIGCTRMSVNGVPTTEPFGYVECKGGSLRNGGIVHVSYVG